MFKPDDTTTLEEYITQLHIAISHLDEGSLRDRFLDHLEDQQETLLFLEEAFRLTPYESNRSL